MNKHVNEVIKMNVMWPFCVKCHIRQDWRREIFPYTRATTIMYDEEK
jgi:hypothetical protein